jgi:hypothetical protein
MEREGFGDIGLIQSDKPEEYEQAFDYFKFCLDKFISNPEEFKGAGAILGMSRIDPKLGAGFLPLFWAEQFEPGNPYRRYLLSLAIKYRTEETESARYKGRRWGTSDTLALEMLMLPRKEILKQEKSDNPDGADAAVSRASKKFGTQVTEEWRELIGASPWVMGVSKFFIWKLGYDPVEEEKLADQFASAMNEYLNGLYDKAHEELEKFGQTTEDEMRVWRLEWRESLKKAIDQNPDLKTLLIPFFVKDAKD